MKIFGYSIDVYYKGKYYGCYSIPKPDRTLMGYSGRKEETLEETLYFKKRKIKAGEIIKTECNPLCGRIE